LGNTCDIIQTPNQCETMCATAGTEPSDTGHNLTALEDMSHSYTKFRDVLVLWSFQTEAKYPSCSVKGR
jgi:hypothetical protein